ncbi:sodium-dependent lysophosphatidylcholine symporter 1-like [Branchiostoma lanceolatum]|uniref:sodium-dependent lysophosphatidylcholine symporter 1-like n=1 Tax=Branchiostoma lanceolatum TaxID=7740 RepID=UPI003455AD3C
MATTGKTDRPSTVEKVCYGLGALPYMTTRHVLNFYLNYFLVTVAQVPPLGLLLVGVLGRVAEMSSYPVLTFLITRTNTRWGQLKPWILGGTLAMVPLYLLVWYVPDVAPGGKIAYFVALFMTESVFNSGVTLAHRTLVMYISDDGTDRESAIAFKSASGLVGMVVGVAIEGQVVAAFDGTLSGTCNHSNNSTNSNVTSTASLQTRRQETGYLVAAGIICVVALIFVTVTLATVKERTAFQQQKTDEPWSSSLKRVMTHKPSVCALLLMLGFTTAGSVLQQSMALYVQYSLGLGSQVQNCLLVLVGSCLIGIPVVKVLMTKFGKKPVSVGVTLILIPIVLGLLFVPGNLVYVLPLLAAFGMTFSSPFIVPLMMLSDVSDLLKLQTGRSYDTVLHGVFSTAQRIVGAVSFGAISAALEIGGYESGDCDQPESVGRAVRWNVTILPMLSLVASLGVLW